MDSNSRDSEYNLAIKNLFHGEIMERASCLLYTSPSPRDRS